MTCYEIQRAFRAGKLTRDETLRLLMSGNASLRLSYAAAIWLLGE